MIALLVTALIALDLAVSARVIHGAIVLWTVDGAIKAAEVWT